MKNSVSEILKVEKPSRYFPVELNTTKKDFDKSSVNICISYPDSYEIGMSNLGIRILYGVINSVERFNCDRIFAPFKDYEEFIRAGRAKFVSIENSRSLKEFDILGFSFQYELLYTNFLNILSLSDIPLRKEERGEEYPLIIAGGPTVFNPRILDNIVDFVFIGEAEESILEFLNEYERLKKENFSKKEIIERLSDIKGVYSTWNQKKTSRVYIKDFENSFYPTKWMVPTIKIVHDRVFLEIMRGCDSGCRFCQAGFVYRPTRHKSVEKTKKLAKELIENTGYEEISLASLSTSDYPGLEELTSYISSEFKEKKISISLPSLRINSDTIRLLKDILKVKKTGLTFACEAGSQHLRNAINKKIKREELIEKLKELFKEGWLTVKLYFMLGLPFEDENEMDEIVKLIKECSNIAKIYGGKRANVTASFSTFVPKPFTPFQWSRMLDVEEIQNRIRFLKDNLRIRNVKLKWHEAGMSVLEGVLSRANSDMGEVIIKAFEKGARFDGWTDSFDFGLWEQAFKECNIDYKEYIKDIELSADLPWDIVDTGVKKEYLCSEYEKALKEETTQDCIVNVCKKCGIC